MIICAQIPPKKYEHFATYAYFLFILFLTIVLYKGHTINGAKRWVNFLGLLSFQPSEIAKLIVPLFLSRFLHRNCIPLSLIDTIIVFIFVLIPVLLIGIQPDLGTAILLAISSIIILFLIGLQIKIIIFINTLTIIFIPILWYFLMFDYQKYRIITLFNPTKDFLGSSYNIIQSKIAIGSGGLYGKGWLSGNQTKLDFLPESHTDFIFSVLAEEFGLIGVLILLFLYLLLIFRTMFIAIKTNSIFGKVMSSSIMVFLSLYIITNIGMVSGLIPVVGVPLLLFSYGGSSTVIVSSYIGILMSIYTEKKYKLIVKK